MAIQYLDTVKALPADQLRRLFMAVGWSDGSETPQQQERFNIGFINATLVVSAWEGERLIGAVRVLSDQVFRSIIYDPVSYTHLAPTPTRPATYSRTTTWSTR